MDLFLHTWFISGTSSPPPPENPTGGADLLWAFIGRPGSPTPVTPEIGGCDLLWSFIGGGFPTPVTIGVGISLPAEGFTALDLAAKGHT